MSIVLLNFLISIVSQSYTRVYENKDYLDNLSKSKLIENINLINDKNGILPKIDILIFSIMKTKQADEV